VRNPGSATPPDAPYGRLGLSASLREGSRPGAAGVKGSRFRHKRAPPRQAADPPIYFRVAAVAPLHPGLKAPGPRASYGRPLGKKNMRQLCFSLLPDGPQQEGDASPGVPPRPRRYRQAATVSPRVAETLTADQDVRKRLLSCGPDALTPVEALTVLLGERSLVPAARLLAAFGSLTALGRGRRRRSWPAG
jgi:hypothetical protein